jgi:hypothetical protein
LKETVQNLAGATRNPLTLDRVDRDQNGVMRFALPHQRGQRRIAGIAAVPVGLAVDLDRLKHRRQAGRREQDVRRHRVVLEHFASAGANVSGGDEQVNGRLREQLKID